MMKTLRKITSIGLVGILAGSIGAGLTFKDWKGALAEDLGEVKVVVGAEAKTADVIGAIDVAQALQYLSKEEVVPEDVKVVFEEKVGKIEGFTLETVTDKLLINEQLSNAGITVLTKDELPSILEEYTIQVDTTTHKVEQKIDLSSTQVTIRFGRPDTEEYKKPILYLDANGKKLYDLTVTFTPAINFTKAKGKAIKLFGKTFIVGSGTDNNKIELYEAAIEKTIGLEEEETINVGDKTLTIKVTGANSADGKVILEINGESYVLGKGDAIVVDGVEIYAAEVYITDIPEKSASVKLLIGTEKWTIQGSSLHKGDQLVSDVSVVWDGNAEQVSSIKFGITGPTDTYVEVGKELVDPVFGTFKIVFDRVVPELTADERNFVRVYMPTDTEVRVKIETVDGVYDVPLIKYDSGSNSHVFKLYKADSSGTERAGKGDYVYNNGRIFQIVSIDTSNDLITLKDVLTGTLYTKEYQDGNNAVDVTIDVGGISYEFDVEDDGVKVDKYEDKGDTVSLGFNTANGGKVVIEVKDANTGSSGFTFAANEEIKIKVYPKGGVGVSEDVTAQINFNNNKYDISINSVQTHSEEGTGIKYAVTDYSYVVFKDEAPEDLKIYSTTDLNKQHFKVVIAPTEAGKIAERKELTTGDEMDGWVLKEIKIGEEKLYVPKPLPFVGVLDTEISGTEWTKIISVGGPAVNRITAELLGVPYPTYGDALKEQGILNENEGLIQIVEKDGKVAVLVFGWEAEQTREATKALARYIIEEANKEVFDEADKVKVVKSETGYEVISG